MGIERDWYTTEEAAHELGIAPSTIRGAAKRGVLKVEVIAPRVRAITREELERYRVEHLGKNWETRRAGQGDPGRAAYHRDYRARRKAREVSKSGCSTDSGASTHHTSDTATPGSTSAG